MPVPSGTSRALSNDSQKCSHSNKNGQIRSLYAANVHNYDRKSAFSVLYVHVLSYISTEKAGLDEIKKRVLDNFIFY